MMKNNEERKMYKATCSECGADTEVPFEPDPSRPVFCRECFMKKRNNNRRPGGFRDRGPRRDDY